MSSHLPGPSVDERYHSIDLHPAEDPPLPPQVTRFQSRDNFSTDSHSPLSPSPYLPRPTVEQNPPSESRVHIMTPQRPESPARDNGNGTASSSGHATPSRTHKSRNSSWDVLGGIQKDWEGFDSRNASATHLQFAQGDTPNNKLSKLYNYLLNSSIVARWIIFIVPVLALLWIPGILSLTAFPTASIWHVRLLWWSVWFSIIWGGWWAALAFSMMLPHLLKSTLGLAAVSLRKYFDWLTRLRRPVAFVAWSIGVWVSFNPVINNRFSSSDATKFPASKSSLALIGRLTFGIMLCALILFGEKFAIQWIAYKFHQISYEDRITEQKVQTQCLTILYRNSSDVARDDTLHNPPSSRGGSMSINPTKFFKKALKGVRQTATTTTTAFGNMASEIAGTSLLQPNSPQAMVATALSSSNKTKMLARRLFYSFKSPDSEHIILGDISRFFPTREQASFAFEIFDKDGNGDVSRDEIEAALLEIHAERLSLAASMKDVDSATGRLDNILMALYLMLVLLILAIMLDAQVSSLVTGAGTLILGLSWLIGGSAQEVLTSIIFLFIKHPFDIGDSIDIEKENYTVKEIRLLSTIFVDSRGCDVQCPNTILNGKYIMNRRRSGVMSEPYEFSVGYSTTFDQIEALRSKMLKFVRTERRDYFPVFDIVVLDLPEQAHMVLKADIKYKSNWQMGGLKAQRRNKWICALKTSLAAVKIYGPMGNPDAPPSTKQVTLVPWEEVHSEGFKFPEPVDTERTNWQFSDKNAALANETGNIYGEDQEIRMPTPTPGNSRTPDASLRARNLPGGSPAPSYPRAMMPEHFEMTPNRNGPV